MTRAWERAILACGEESALSLSRGEVMTAVGRRRPTAIESYRPLVRVGDGFVAAVCAPWQLRFHLRRRCIGKFPDWLPLRRARVFHQRRDDCSAARFA